MKRDHVTLLAAAGFDRFLLDRLSLDDDAPLPCEVGRVREALDRLARPAHDGGGEAMNARPAASACWSAPGLRSYCSAVPLSAIGFVTSIKA